MLTIIDTRRPLNEANIDELEKLLSIPLDSLVLKLLDLDNYSDITPFLPWNNRCHVAVVILLDVQASGKVLTYVCQIE